MKTEIYTIYSSSEDMTFIMQDAFNENDEILSTECLGWYYGEPDEKATEDHKGIFKAEF